MKKKRDLKQVLLLAFCVYWLVLGVLYFASGDGIHKGTSMTTMLDAKGVIPAVTSETVISQAFICPSDTLDEITFFGATYARHNTDILEISVLNRSGAMLAVQELKTAELADNSYWNVVFPRPIQNVKGEELTIQISSEHGSLEDGITLYYGDSVSSSRGNVAVEIPENMKVCINGSPLNGQLCYFLTGTNFYLMGSYFWQSSFLLGSLLLIYGFWLLQCERNHRKSFGLSVISQFSKYKFLNHQLVSRDFKTKYKRSVLGVFWSFLNPLLTMFVQYVVFSTLFKTNIQNFAVYLLIGIISFNFFSEVTTMCMTSITGNAALITKVYIPKYIFPFSRALSSSINLMLSLIPLMIMVILTKAPISKAILLLPFVIVCLFFLSLGFGMILAVLMVFFRDTQFLWSVISMIWMYLTPIFYPESIIPARFLTLYRMNPMYQIITAFRTILLQGVSPTPQSYLFCLLSGLIPLLVGIVFFKKTQDRFILNL